MQSELLKQHQKYADIRKRLMGRKRTVNITVKCLPHEEEERPSKTSFRPLWQIFQLNFDNHVLKYRGLIHDAAKVAAELERIKAAVDFNIQDFAETYIERKSSKQIIMETLAKIDSEVTWDEIMGRRRKREIVSARHQCIYEVHMQRPDLSLPAIGRIFGGKDHTSIIFSINKIKALHGDKAAARFITNKKVKMDLWLNEMKEGKRTKIVGDKAVVS